MKRIRQIHVYLGCFFAPMILYFSLSGVWQVFRLNDLPRKSPKKSELPVVQGDSSEAFRKNETESAQIKQSSVRILFNELSKPHTNSTAPGASPRQDRAQGFDWIAAAMGLGLFTTTLLGMLLALQPPKKRSRVVSSMLAGFIIPILLLFFGRI